MENYSIRHATNKDSPEIVFLIFDIWRTEYHFNVHPHDYPDLHHIQEYYFDKGGMFLVASTQNHILGTIAYERLNDRTYVLKRFFLQKEFRGKGIAQALLDALLENRSPPYSFYLSTKEGVALAAEKFYQKNGFERIPKEVLPSGFPFFEEDDAFLKKEIF